MAADLHYKFQLMDLVTRKAIITTGGIVHVTAAGAQAEAATLNKDGSALANPISLTRGSAEFYLPSTVATVDLFIDCPGGHFVVVDDFGPGDNEVWVDTSRTTGMMVIPFDQADFTANTEKDSGFNTRPATGRVFLPTPVVNVVTLDASETIDVGTDGSGSNDPNGFLAAASINAAAIVPGVLLNGGITLGALFVKQDSANAGDGAPSTHFNATDEDITYTTSAGSDTGTGYICLPFELVKV